MTVARCLVVEFWTRKIRDLCQIYTEWLIGPGKSEDHGHVSLFDTGPGKPKYHVFFRRLRARKTRSQNPQEVGIELGKLEDLTLQLSLWLSCEVKELDRVPKIPPVERLFRLFPSGSWLVILQP